MKFEVEIIKPSNRRFTVQYDCLYHTTDTVYAYVGAVLSDTFSLTRFRKRDDHHFAYYSI